jgi:hypothetical protein
VVIDLKKDKTEFATELNKKKAETADLITKVYEAYEQETINEYVAMIESLHVVKDKID